MDYNWGSSGLEVIASYNWSGPQHGSSPILGEAFDHWLGFCWRSWLWSLLRKWIWSLCRETQLALGPLLSQGEWLTPGGGMLGGGRSWGLQPGGRVAGGLEPITTAALEAEPEHSSDGRVYRPWIIWKVSMCTYSLTYISDSYIIDRYRFIGVINHWAA